MRWMLPSVCMLSAVFSGCDNGSGPPGPGADVTPPIITGTVDDGHYIRGTFAYTSTVFDDSAIDSVKLYIDEAYVASASVGAFGEVQFEIDTVPFGDRAITTKIVATDANGYASEHIRSFIIDNTNPIVNIDSPLMVNNANYTLTGTYEDNGVFGVLSIVVNGQAANVYLNGTWDIPITLALDLNDVAVQVSDYAGNTGTINTQVGYDSRAPFYTVRQGGGNSTNWSCAGGGQTWSLFGYDYRINEKSSFGLTIDPNVLGLNNISYIFLDPGDEWGVPNEAFTPVGEVRLQIQYEVNGGIKRAWTDHSHKWGASFIIPLTDEFLSVDWTTFSSITDQHKLRFRVIDSAGNANSPFAMNFQVEYCPI